MRIVAAFSIGLALLAGVPTENSIRHDKATGSNPVTERRTEFSVGTATYGRFFFIASMPFRRTSFTTSLTRTDGFPRRSACAFRAAVSSVRSAATSGSTKRDIFTRSLLDFRFAMPEQYATPPHASR